MVNMSRDVAPIGRQSISRPSNASTRSVNRFVTSSSASSSQSISSAAGNDVSDHLTDGITGSAMTVPPPKSNVLSQKHENAKPSGSPRKSITVSKSECSNVDARSLKEMSDRNRELKESLAREKQQVTKLEQLAERLQIELENAQQCNAGLQEEIKEKADNFRELFEKERLARQKAEQELEQKSAQLRLKEEVLSQYVQQVSDLNNSLKKQETEFANMKAEKDHEISVRDAKLERLKQQMAEALQGNSWQRQQQLDELNKELMKVQEEADILRSTLRSTNKNGCSNCDKLSSKLSNLEVAATLGDRTITDLKQLVAAYEKQLGSNSLQRSAVIVSKTNKQHSK